MRAMVEAIRALGRLPEDAAKLGAPVIEDLSKRQARAGVAPDGQPWAPRVRDGKPALAYAAAFIKASAIGTIIQLTLAFPYSLHNFGAGHAEKRKILPSGGSGSMPAAFGQALLKAAREAFLKIVGSRG